MSSSVKSLTSNKPGAASRPSANEELNQQTLTVGLLAALASVLAFAYCYSHSLLLLYGDAVAHLGIARRITDSLHPGLVQLGSVWLPFPHLLMAPLAMRMSWWQNGIAGALPSMVCYILSVIALFRLARLWLPPMGAVIAVLFYGLNPGLLYMQTTAMGEPVYLAEMIASLLFMAGAIRALRAQEPRRAAQSMIWLTLTLIAAVFTRYDGWILATLAWLFVAAAMVRSQSCAQTGVCLWRSRAGAAFAAMTALVGASPLVWFWWNAHEFGDWLSFMRGPYSARAIALRTTPVGAHPYPGWHNFGVAGLYYLKAATLGMVPNLLTWILLLLAVLGTVAALRWLRGSALVPVLVLLWMPVPFYAWSVAYSWVPIFLPVWPPHSYYNTRYGMEMLPAFALMLGFFFAAAGVWIERRGPRWAPLVALVAICLAILNAGAQMHTRPLVLAEAEANARTRIPYEAAFARGLDQLPSYGEILAYTSAHVGAYERARIPLRRTINEGDGMAWLRALKDPAQVAPFVIAEDGDPVAQAIAAHPGGLRSLMVICSTGQPCVHFYRSTEVALDGSIIEKPLSKRRNTD